ncbi:uncharacterized protein [Cherax quadricarinatus]|uniref:uncharacterized protein isoform X4 n=1 Tax=Cherax quadricarinatus TaxID=27406 RepID=UPI00387E7B0B
MDEQQEGMDVKLVDASCVHEEPMEVGSSCTYAEPHISKDETTNIGNAGVVLHGTKKMAEDLPDDRKAGFLHCNDEGLYPATCIHKQVVENADKELFLKESTRCF